MSQTALITEITGHARRGDDVWWEVIGHYCEPGPLTKRGRNYIYE